MNARRTSALAHPRHCRRRRLDVPIASSSVSTPRPGSALLVHTPAMASIMRPSLFRQAVQKPNTAQRMLSTVTSSTFNRPLAQQLRPAFQRSAIPQATRVAAFHATQRNQILPPLPQKIIGTTNDPTPVPDPSYAHGSYHWSFERSVDSMLHWRVKEHDVAQGLWVFWTRLTQNNRIISAGILPLTIAPFAAGSLNPVTDSLFCALLVIHSHIGFEYVSYTLDDFEEMTY